MATLGGLSFDLDYTLWDLDNVIEEAERRLQAHLHQHHPVITERFDLEGFRGLRAEVLRQDPGIGYNMTELRLRMLRLAARSVGAPESLAEAAFTVFLDARHEVVLYDDSHTVLAQLHGRLPLMALTNGNADVHRLGLGHYFSHVLCPRDVGSAKPAPEMFQTACLRSGLEPAQIVHVGDDPETDVTGAVRAGMRAVWLNRAGLPWPDHLEPVEHVEIRDLHALLGMLPPG